MSDAAVGLGVQMAGNSDIPFWWKALSWLRSVPKYFARLAAIRRDALLKKYTGDFTWVDRTLIITVSVERVIAENEDQARRLANAQAAKDFPIITSMFQDGEMVPPYMKDPVAALSQWDIKEVPLTEPERAFAKNGELGPAHASSASKAATLAPV